MYLFMAGGTEGHKVPFESLPECLGEFLGPSLSYSGSVASMSQFVPPWRELISSAL